VPITAKLVANLITRSGADRVLTMDLHAQQLQGFFDIPVDHLYAAPVLNAHFLQMHWPEDEVVIVSPDAGSIKRAVNHSRRLGGHLAIVDKRRSNALETRQENIIGESVAGRIAVMFDDMITTAGSICGAAQFVHEAGAREIHVAASHGVFCGPAIERIAAAPVDSVTITDSIPLSPDRSLSKIKVLSVAPLLAEAIKRIHQDQSISKLFDGPK
jgi:ribose-phosphate pyrophosphokinase